MELKTSTGGARSANPTPVGGAIATQVRVGSPLFTHTLFPVYVAALVWGGLLLRQPRLRAIVFLQSKETPTAGTS